MTDAASIDPSAIDPNAIDALAIDPVEFANMVRTTQDEQLLQALGSARELILGEIFRRMEEHFDAEKAAGVDAVVHWKITGREDGEADQYQVTIRDGACKVEPGGADTPRIIFELPALNFIKLATGNALGPALFLSGGLRIEGDMMFAALVQTFFLIPEPTPAAGSEPAETA